MTYKELLLLLLRGFVIEATSLDNFVIDIELVTGTRKHGLFHALLGDEPQNAHDLRLSDTMRTILRLEISMGIPVVHKTRKYIHSRREFCC